MKLARFPPNGGTGRIIFLTRIFLTSSSRENRKQVLVRRHRPRKARLRRNPPQRARGGGGFWISFNHFREVGLELSCPDEDQVSRFCAALLKLSRNLIAARCQLQCKLLRSRRPELVQPQSHGVSGTAPDRDDIIIEAAGSARMPSVRKVEFSIPSTSVQKIEMDFIGKLHSAIVQHRAQAQADILFSHIPKRDLKLRIIPIAGHQDGEGHLQAVACRSPLPALHGTSRRRAASRQAAAQNERESEHDLGFHNLLDGNPWIILCRAGNQFLSSPAKALRLAHKRNKARAATTIPIGRAL